MLLLKRNPFYLFALPLWLLGGRAVMKKKIAERTDLNPAGLPYHQPFLEYLKEERQKGRTIILATAADHRLAQSVAQHTGLFTEIFASNGATNMRGKNKGHALAGRFGKKGFDYAGNSTVDYDPASFKLVPKGSCITMKTPAETGVAVKATWPFAAPRPAEPARPCLPPFTPNGSTSTLPKPASRLPTGRSAAVAASRRSRTRPSTSAPRTAR